MKLRAMTSPVFDAEFRAQFERLLKWRRDVRSFRRDKVDPDLIEHLICLASLAPSVGYSQPWRFVLVDSSDRRRAIRLNFERCNREALNLYPGEKARLYASLKLAGLRDAPVQLAVFLDTKTNHGSGLGRATMPQTLEYSSVLAVHTLWLAARCYGLGVGWVSILEPGKVARVLEVPEGWKLIAYLCIGYPEVEHDQPELRRSGWESLIPDTDIILRR
jgi:5,6-dimethylbenzimidazole synthase